MMLNKSSTTVAADGSAFFFFGPFAEGDLIRSINIGATIIAGGVRPLRVGLALFRDKPPATNAAFAGGYQLCASGDSVTGVAVDGIPVMAFDTDKVEIQVREEVSRHHWLGVVAIPLGVAVDAISVSVLADPVGNKRGWSRP